MLSRAMIFALKMNRFHTKNPKIAKAGGNTRLIGSTLWILDNATIEDSPKRSTINPSETVLQFPTRTLNQ
ncbi:hypothetical protein HanXRQr2_Chr13g0619151 [Helianthus annuus]|uniref:Uncharacterized protein n=1 Tax=Helianthus annuus TaxID=4232 RepID=A0A9K3HEB7_HELAN|nr:hypothetical protein HanXRQr2_Chr13g0619151 [Helianthus annuus]